VRLFLRFYPPQEDLPEQAPFLARLFGARVQLAFNDVSSWLTWLAGVAKSLDDATLQRALEHALAFVCPGDLIAEENSGVASVSVTAPAADVVAKNDAAAATATAAVSPSQQIPLSMELAFCDILGVVCKRKDLKFWTSVRKSHWSFVLRLVSRIACDTSGYENESHGTLRDDPPIELEAHRRELLFDCDSLRASCMILGQSHLSERVSDAWMHALIYLAGEPATSEQDGARILERWRDSGVVSILIFLMQPWSVEQAHINFGFKIWKALLKANAVALCNQPAHAMYLLDQGFGKMLVQHVVHLAKIIDTTTRIAAAPQKPRSYNVWTFSRTRPSVDSGDEENEYRSSDAQGVAVDTHVHETRMRDVFELINLFLGLDVAVAQVAYLDCIEGEAEPALEQLSTSDEATRDVRRAAISLMKRIMISNRAVAPTTEADADADADADDEEKAAEREKAEDSAATSHKVCSICLGSKLLTQFILFVPCNHLSCCTVCAPQVKQCPNCRVQITDRRKIFI
jgi:hypothetical protein